MDGGTVWNVNVASAINGCLTKVDTLEQIIVDVLICTPHVMETAVPGKTIDNFLRGRNIRKWYSNADGIQTAIAAFPGVNWRYLIMEQDPYKGKAELDFNSDATWPSQVQGREQSKEVLAYGPGYGFDSYIW